MSIMDILAGVHDSAAEEHGNEHTLPGTDVGHIASFKEVLEAIVCQDLIVETLRSSPDGAISPD
jgi:hypothetical protein